MSKKLLADLPDGDTCGCTLFEGFCEKHQAMMREIHEVWTTSRSNAMMELIWSLSDGYGEPGLVPVQGYDWSGIRDSSTDAIEEMYQAIHA